MGVLMKHTDARIQPDRQAGDSGLGFKESVEVIKECVWWIGGESWVPGDR
jgi:hypothetical protein